MHAYRNRQIRWRKAKRSFANNECVEVAHLSDAIAVRDSTLASRADVEVLSARPAHWKGIVDAIKAGGFDR
ncbi:DUF397 domain-containing protein [Stackebrandtia soli]|uniref:DUF397 domain-containing protein n=1 Tax=Stackebrandtia soli TaxID=1892856 RepID=UPI0039E9A2AA